MSQSLNRRCFLMQAAFGIAASASLPGMVGGAAASPYRIDWDAAPLRLMMVESRGCVYCAAWQREIGPSYANSREGRTAPLLTIDINAPWPNGIALERRPIMTPTFILLQRGIELSRLEGYPGAKYFFPVIADMMAEAGVAPGQ